MIGLTALAVAMMIVMTKEIDKEQLVHQISAILAILALGLAVSPFGKDEGFSNVPLLSRITPAAVFVSLCVYIAWAITKEAIFFWSDWGVGGAHILRWCFVNNPPQKSDTYWQRLLQGNQSSQWRWILAGIELFTRSCALEALNSSSRQLQIYLNHRSSKKVKRLLAPRPTCYNVNSRNTNIYAERTRYVQQKRI